MQETQVQFLGLEDSLEKEMAIHSSILAWEITRVETSGRLWFAKESDKTWQLKNNNIYCITQEITAIIL